MLPKKNRLQKKKDFEQVFKKGKRLKADFFILKFAPNNLGKSRFAVSVSQKISKKANVRNKIKRRIRAMLYKKLPKIENGFDVIISALPGIENIEFSETEKAIGKLLGKSKIKYQKSKCNVKCKKNSF